MNGTMETTHRLHEYDNPYSYLAQQHGVETERDYLTRRTELQQRLADINGALIDLTNAWQQTLRRGNRQRRNER